MIYFQKLARKKLDLSVLNQQKIINTDKHIKINNHNHNLHMIVIQKELYNVIYVSIFTKY